MSDVTFRLAHLGEDAAIKAFINEHFDMRLPLVNRPEFYHYYYAGRGGVPQFAVAEQDGRYLSAAGYVLANTSANPDVWVSVWVAVKGHNGVGLELMNALPGLTHARVLACNNIRAATCAMYRFLGWKAERMSHYYRLADLPAYSLASPGPKTILPVMGARVLKRVASAADLIPLGMPKTNHTPRKDMWYMMRRYFHFPHFHYDVWAAMNYGRADAYVVTRLVTAQDTGRAAVLRLVDYIGPDELLPQLGRAIDNILQESGAEYIDCYNAGISEEIWRAAGFVEREPGDGVVIPNYLTPPLLENTEYYYFTNEPEHFVIFRADGDQDRPNLPPDA